MESARVYQFTVERAELQEAMLAAGRMLMSTRSKAIQWVLTILLIVLSGLGGMTAADFLFGSADGAPAGLFPILGWLFGGFAFIALQNIAVRALAVSSARTGLHRGTQTVEIEEPGITFGTASSQWHTGWAEVEAVRETPRTVVFSIGGLAIYVPKTVIGSLEDARDLVQFAEERIDHA